MIKSSIPVALFDRLQDEEIAPRESVRRELRRLFNSRAPADADALPPLLAWGVPEWHGLKGAMSGCLTGFAASFAPPFYAMSRASRRSRCVPKRRIIRR